MKNKKEKKSLKQKTIEIMFGSKIRGLVRSYRRKVIIECFNTINENYYNEFGLQVEEILLDFLDRVKNKLLTIDALEEIPDNSVNDLKDDDSNKVINERC